MSLRGDARTLGGVIAVLRPVARAERGTLAAGAILGVVAVAFCLVRPWPLKWVLDAVTGASAQGTVMAWVRDAGTMGLAVLSLAYIGVTAAYAFATYWQVILLNGAGNRVVFRFRAALFTHVLRQPLSFHESRDVGELLTRIVYDTQRLRRGLNGLVVSSAQTLPLFVGTLAVLLWLSPPLATVLGVGVAAAFLTMYSRGQRVVRAAKKQRKKEGAVAALVEEELHGVRELHAFGPGSSPVQARFAGRSAKSLVGEQKVRRLAAGISVRIEVLFAVTIGLTILLATRGASSRVFTVGDLVLFFSYALALRGPFDEFARQTSRLGRTAASASRLVKLMSRPLALVDVPQAVTAAALRGQLTFEGVTVRAPKKARGSRKWSLNDVWADLPDGTRVAVVGPNGAGKSALLRVAMRLADPDAGRVRVDGRDAREYTAASLREHYSVVFHDSVFFGLSVRDNIALGTPDASAEAIREAARRAGAAELIARLPQQYETLIRRRGGLFSPGERQRLAIARALLRKGRIWLLDEPTTALDRRGALVLTDELLAATHGHTTLWVTHDPAIARKLDLVIALDGGKARFVGTPAEYEARRSGAVPEVVSE